jgi:hypothetical protein
MGCVAEKMEKKRKEKEAGVAEFLAHGRYIE